jgi:GT2 family glycosyltransferase
MHKVSVVIVNWNARNYLRDCLVSLRETRDPSDVEVIVVDNASTDGSPDMVAAEFPEVRLIRSKENLGFAAGNNLGLRNASHPFIALINSDVIVDRDCLDRLASFLESHSEVGLVGPKVFGRDGMLQRTCWRLPTLWNTTCRVLALDNVFPHWPLFSGREMRHWNHDNQAEVEVLSGCFWMVRRSAANEVGGLDERFFFYAEDLDWCKRFREAGWKVVFVAEARATHFGGASSGTAPMRYSIELLRANLAYWKKHHGFMGQVAFYLLSLFHHILRLVLRTTKAAALWKHDDETSFKCRRSFVCLRWLLSGKLI